MNSGLARSFLLCLLMETAGAAAGAQNPRPSQLVPFAPPPLDDRPVLARQDVLTVAEEVSTGTIVRIDDGDSVVVREANQPVRLRLDGVDAPEISQPFGSQSRDYLASLVLNKSVRVRVKGRAARGGESRARLELNGADVSALLLRDGMARYCSQHSEDAALRQAESDARKAGRGLWAAPETPTPWQHRGVRHCWQE
jgi:endonuclease YncB( thermonuclease family)